MPAAALAAATNLAAKAAKQAHNRLYRKKHKKIRVREVRASLPYFMTCPSNRILGIELLAETFSPVQTLTARKGTPSSLPDSSSDD